MEPNAKNNNQKINVGNAYIIHNTLYHKRPYNIIIAKINQEFKTVSYM